MTGLTGAPAQAFDPRPQAGVDNPVYLCFKHPSDWTSSKVLVDEDGYRWTGEDAKRELRFATYEWWGVGFPVLSLEINCSHPDARARDPVEVYWVSSLGGGLGQAFFPPGGPQYIYFALDIEWSFNEAGPVGERFDFRSTAAHEVGHAIGLKHPEAGNDDPGGGQTLHPGSGYPFASWEAWSATLRIPIMKGKSAARSIRRHVTQDDTSGARWASRRQWLPDPGMNQPLRHWNAAGGNLSDVGGEVRLTSPDASSRMWVTTRLTTDHRSERQTPTVKVRWHQGGGGEGGKIRLRLDFRQVNPGTQNPSDWVQMAADWCYDRTKGDPWETCQRSFQLLNLMVQDIRLVIRNKTGGPIFVTTAKAWDDEGSAQYGSSTQDPEGDEAPPGPPPPPPPPPPQWSDWERHEGQITSGLAVTAPITNRLEVFARGPDGKNLVTRIWDGQRWNPGPDMTGWDWWPFGHGTPRIPYRDESPDTGDPVLQGATSDPEAVVFPHSSSGSPCDGWAAGWNTDQAIFVRGPDSGLWFRTFSCWGGTASPGWHWDFDRIGSGCCRYVDFLQDRELPRRYLDASAVAGAPAVVALTDLDFVFFVKRGDPFDLNLGEAPTHRGLWHISPGFFPDKTLGCSPTCVEHSFDDYEVEYIEGDITSDPAAVNANGVIHVFARGGDNTLQHGKWSLSSGWSGWESMGGNLTSAPAVASWGSRVDVFAAMDDGALWQTTSWDGNNWTDWGSLGGTVTANPAAVSWGPNRIDVFIRGEDGVMYHKWWA